jgi:type II secretory pathway component GspD/PulD (secretin)
LVARATAKSWCNLIAGLVAGAALVPASALAGADDRGPVLVAQLFGRSSRAHSALNAGIEAQRRGDYEGAAKLFLDAQARQDDLSAQEREELARLIRDNTLALEARREGATLIRQAETALREGRSAAAAELVKKAAASEQYLAPMDKTRFVRMSQQMRLSGSMPGGITVRASAAQGRSLAVQARAQFQQGNWEAAEALAREAEQSGAVFAPTEDSPRRILEDLAKAHKDRKALLFAARAALARRDYDLAELYVHEAEQLPTNVGMPWADTPAKVLKEIQAARAQAPAASPNLRNAPRPDQVTQNSKPGSVLAPRPDGMNPGAMPEVGNRSSAGPPARTKEEAVALVKQGRQQLAEGKVDDATNSAQRARALTTARWGLFEDSPDALLGDITKAQSQKGKDESSQILAEARRLLEKGDYDGAEREAYRAKTLHGPYSIWELGDRPDKVLADVQAAREKNHKPTLPPAPLAAGGSNALPPLGGPAMGPGGPPAGPTAPPGMGTASSPVLEARARQMLAEARQAVQLGDFVKAKVLADQVRDLHVTLNRPGDDSPEGIYRALAQKSAPRGTDGPIGGGLAFNQAPPGQPVPQAAPRPAADNTAARTKALYLIAEARQCLREDRLLEARQKAIEAQRLGVAFRPAEDGPELLLQQVSVRARQRVDGLMAQANEVMRGSAGDPRARAQKATEILGQARQLATAFGQDPQPVDQMLAGVQGQGNLPPADGAAFAGTSRPGQPPASPVGLEKLNKARLELRNGETAMARRLAEEACNPQYGVRDDAIALLRSIDTEEFNQRRLRAIRTFDAAWSAYVRHDYAHAGNMITAIDVRLLDESRQAKLRDMMTTPEMQPAARGGVALAAGQTGSRPGASGGPDADLPLPGPGRVPAPLPGRSQAGESDRALLQRAAAMREVKFQKLRRDGLDVQSTAAEKFRTGQPDAAIDMLQDHLAFLAEQQLEPGQLTQLRRPIESRLQQFKLLRAQEEFANRGSQMHKAAQEKIAKGQLAEENRQKQVSELMKQFHTLYKEAHYAEAESMATRALELDPDNGVISAAVHMARIQANKTAYKKLKDGKEAMFVTGADDAEDEGPARAIKDGMAFNQEVSERSAKRPFQANFTAPLRNEKEKDIERRLNTPVTLSFSDTPLKTVIADLRLDQNLNIYVDDRALLEAGVSLDRPVNVNLDQVSLKSVLNLLLRPLHLTYVIKDEVLQITTEDNAKGKLRRSVYQVADLVIPVENFGNIQDGSTPPAMLGTNVNPPPGSSPSPVSGPMSLSNGAAVGQPTGSQMSGNNGPFAAQQNSSGGVTVNKKYASQTNEEVLIKLIQNNIDPKSWAEMGGPGTIDYFPHTMSLVINQTPDIQDQIAELLAALRRLQDQEVAVEVRFITIAEDFFERIGVNFNMNIVNKSRFRSSLEPLLTSGNFVPDPFINSFNPGHFISGLQPSGTLTPDLSFPIPVNTFAPAIPPFGGYTGMPGYGGLTFGLAFLSDIQVFLFMEAAQGDRRTNVMQAPKLTLFNGQTATLTVADSQFFLTSVQVVPQQGIFTYNPTVTTFPLGVVLAIQAVISADRRFVRMSLTPTLTNLANPIVDLFPVVVPIFPLFDNTGTGQPIVFTQFIQLPRITRVAVLTTVAVPDGGTVLMGGLKRLSEGRNEYGPPVLSKVPFLNRLFKNVGYGREAESLLIMVTPRIIIQAEEEERQTGVHIEPLERP